MLEEQVWCHSFIKFDPVGEVTRLTASDPNYFISSGSLVEITFILGKPQRLIIYYSICHYELAHMTNILKIGKTTDYIMRHVPITSSQFLFAMEISNK